MNLNRPPVFVGVDVGIRRDFTAIVGVCKEESGRTIRTVGYRLWEPKKMPDGVNVEVDLSDVTACLERICGLFNVARIAYDPWQFMGSAQQLAAKGHRHRLMECNQQTESVAFSNGLYDAFRNDSLTLIDDITLKSHLTSCNAEVSERGFKIVKRKQSRKIDLAIALAMAA